MIIINLGLAIAPALFLVIYFYRKDSLKREPKGMIIRVFLLGILSVIPAVILGIFIDNIRGFTENPWLDSIFQAFIIAALVEELSKFLIFQIFVKKNRHFDEITDGIVYFAIISLGFACLENILYSVNNLLIGFLRAFTAVPGHAMWSGIMGYYVGQAKFYPDKKKKLILTGLGYGVFYHGFYDFVLFAGINRELVDNYFWLSFLIVPILITGWIHLHKLFRQAQKKDAQMLNLEE
jgi:RsiW-degrading membrane proteinase PrsW (M82 family)